MSDSYEEIDGALAVLARVEPVGDDVLAAARADLLAHMTGTVVLPPAETHVVPPAEHRWVPRQVRRFATPTLLAVGVALTVAVAVLLPFTLLSGGGVVPAEAPATPRGSSLWEDGPNRPEEFLNAKDTYTYMAQQVAKVPPAWEQAAYWYRRTATATSDDLKDIGIHEDWEPRTGGGDPIWGLGNDHYVSWDELWALPTDPVQLEKKLRDQYPGRSTAKVDEQIFLTANLLIAESPAPPKLRAALFRVMAGLPNLTASESTDYVHRLGIYVEGRVDGETVRFTYAVDQGTTYEYRHGKDGVDYLNVGWSEADRTVPGDAELLPIAPVLCDVDPGLPKVAGGALCTGPDPRNADAEYLARVKAQQSALASELGAPVPTQDPRPSPSAGCNPYVEPTYLPAAHPTFEPGADWVCDPKVMQQ